MKAEEIKHPDIPGWGIDANPENEPTYPMKNYTGDDHKRLNWVRPTLQKETVELLRSTERPSNSAVFGTVHPPKGLSGMIRRFAFKYSEDKHRHWLPLMLADRVDVMEGLLDDLVHGRLPRLAKERGWPALAKFKPSLLAWQIGGRLAAVVALGTYWLYRRKLRYS